MFWFILRHSAATFFDQSCHSGSAVSHAKTLSATCIWKTPNSFDERCKCPLHSHKPKRFPSSAGYRPRRHCGFQAPAGRSSQYPATDPGSPCAYLKVLAPNKYYLSSFVAVNQIARSVNRFRIMRIKGILHERNACLPGSFQYQGQEAPRTHNFSSRSPSRRDGLLIENKNAGVAAGFP